MNSITVQDGAPIQLRGKDGWMASSPAAWGIRRTHPPSSALGVPPFGKGASYPMMGYGAGRSNYNSSVVACYNSKSSNQLPPPAPLALTVSKVSNINMPATPPATIHKKSVPEKATIVQDSFGSSSSIDGVTRSSAAGGDRRSGRWTEEEDAILIRAVEESAARKNQIQWTQIAQCYFKGTRNAAQCKSRWNKVRPDLAPAPAALPPAHAFSLIFCCILLCGFSHFLPISIALPLAKKKTRSFGWLGEKGWPTPLSLDGVSLPDLLIRFDSDTATFSTRR